MYVCMYINIYVCTYVYRIRVHFKCTYTWQTPESGQIVLQAVRLLTCCRCVNLIYTMAIVTDLIVAKHLFQIHRHSTCAYACTAIDTSHLDNSQSIHNEIVLSCFCVASSVNLASRTTTIMYTLSSIEILKLFQYRRIFGFLLKTSKRIVSQNTKQVYICLYSSICWSALIIALYSFKLNAAFMTQDKDVMQYQIKVWNHYQN